jgi:hypothetical protein
MKNENFAVVCVIAELLNTRLIIHSLANNESTSACGRGKMIKARRPNFEKLVVMIKTHEKLLRVNL